VSDDAEFIQKINGVEVSPELLGEITVIWASLPSEVWDDFDHRLKHVVDHIVKTRNASDGPMLAMAAALRLMALDSIVKDSHTHAWLVRGRQRGISYIHGDLLKVAAAEGIREDALGNPIFDPESFRARLMALLVTRGRA